MRAVISVGMLLLPRAPLSMSGEISDCEDLELGRGLFRHLVGRSQGGCEISYKAQASPPIDNYPTPKVDKAYTTESESILLFTTQLRKIRK